MATYLQRYARTAADELGPGTHASITVRHFGATARAGSSSDRAARCDDVEERTQVGPCITAMRGMAPVVLPALGGEQRWPEWRAAFREQDFSSFAAVPVVVTARCEVALNLYSVGRREWDTADLAAVRRVADAAAVDVRERLDRAGPARRGDGAEARDRVAQAVGALMELRGCDAPDARALLLRFAERSGAALADVASWVLLAAVSQVGGSR